MKDECGEWQGEKSNEQQKAWKKWNQGRAGQGGKEEEEVRCRICMMKMISVDDSPKRKTIEQAGIWTHFEIEFPKHENCPHMVFIWLHGRDQSVVLHYMFEM